jgi:hypothetical protein
MRRLFRIFGQKSAGLSIVTAGAIAGAGMADQQSKLGKVLAI